MIKIMLLDCSKEIAETLRNKGFYVTEGTLGFHNGKLFFPEAIYEQDMIFFNPSDISFVKNKTPVHKEKENILEFDQFTNISDGIEKTDIIDFFKKGGLYVTFYNPLNLSELQENAVYGWFPHQILSFNTNDKDIKQNLSHEDEKDYPFITLFREFKPTLPVKRILKNVRKYNYPKILLTNSRNEALAIADEFFEGQILHLPKFDNNDYVIEFIVTHIYQILYSVQPDIPAFLNLKKTPQMDKLEEFIQKKETEIGQLTKEIQTLKSKLVEENNRVEKIIKSNPIAVKLTGYLEDALTGQNTAWYPSYKITETLYDHFGNETKAKEVLGLNQEFNFIRRIANSTYRDTRHAPRKGDVVNPPSTEEIEKILNYSKVIVQKYIQSLLHS